MDREKQTENDNADLIKWSEVEGIENEVAGWKHC